MSGIRHVKTCSSESKKVFSLTISIFLCYCVKPKTNTLMYVWLNCFSMTIYEHNLGDTKCAELKQEIKRNPV